MRTISDTGPGLPNSLAVLVLVVGCVPEGPATREEPMVVASGSAAETASTTPPSAEGLSYLESLARRDPVLDEVFVDSFDRVVLGADWRALSAVWRIDDGALCAREARNRGVWLARRLPANVVIEVDVESRATDGDGDMKLELFGDGASGATKATYDDATGYILIYGGWGNRLHVLARLDEHGADRLVVPARPDGPAAKRPVTANSHYHFRIERRDGKTIEWSVSGEPLLELDDKEPLAGVGHDHFAFNNWDAPVCFDNLRVEPL